MDVWSFAEGKWQQGELERADLRWFDLTGDDGAALDELGARFKLHPLAIEDCHSRLMHAPKIDDFGEYLFVVLQALRPNGDGPVTEEFDAFLGHDFLITYKDEPVPEIHAVRSVVDALDQGMAIRPGVDGLLYEVTDRIVDAILPQVHELGDQLDRIEEEVLAGQSHAQQQEILGVRSRSGHIRRVLSTQLNVVQRLSRGEFSQVSEQNRVYFRDIYDHLVRIDLTLEGIREDAEVALSTYLSAFNNRVSEVMKVLAVVATLALPASVIAGVFGTNFDNVPGLHSNWGFALMLGSMAALAVGMALYFRIRHWF